jgi:Tfp pilus assembly protein PilN
VSQVNLLPPEILQGQRYRRSTVAVLLAGIVVLALIFAFYLLQVNRLGSVNDEIDAQEQTNAALQGQINELQPFEDLKVQAEQTQAVLDAAYQNEVSFAGLLLDVSRVIPPDAYLQTYTATITTTVGTPQEGDEGAGTFVGTQSMGGQAIGIDTISTWLIGLQEVRGWVNPWVSSVTVADESIDSFSFTSTVDLTNEVVTKRGKGAADGG